MCNIFFSGSHPARRSDQLSGPAALRVQLVCQAVTWTRRDPHVADPPRPRPARGRHGARICPGPAVTTGAGHLSECRLRRHHRHSASGGAAIPAILPPVPPKPNERPPAARAACKKQPTRCRGAR
jgi:hypothetical protein